MYYIIIFCAVIHLSRCAINHELIQKISCKKSNPEFDKCINDHFRQLGPFLTNGIPDLGIPPLDPLKIPELSIHPELPNVADVDINLKDVEVTGFKNAIFNDVRFDPIKLNGLFNFTIPWAHIETDYNIKGKIIGTSVNNKGRFEGNFTEINIFMKMSLTTFKKDDGKEYLKVNDLTLDLKIGNGHINLISKDKNFQAAVDMATQFFNNNPSFILEAIRPMFAKKSVSMTKNQLNKLLATLPASVLLPD